MRNREWSTLVSVAGRILLAFLFVFSQSAWAGQDSKGKDTPKPAQKAVEKPSSAATTAKTEAEGGQAKTGEESAAEEKPAGDGKHEGIKVHGHWTIEVRNPDGKLVAHREFENSLTIPGGVVLSQVLARQNSVGAWSIFLNSSPGLCLSNGQPTVCIIEEQLGSFTQQSWEFLTLTVNA